MQPALQELNVFLGIEVIVEEIAQTFMIKFRREFMKIQLSNS